MDIDKLLENIPENPGQLQSILVDFLTIQGYSSPDYPQSFLNMTNNSLKKASLKMILLKHTNLDKLDMWDSNSYTFFNYLKFFIYNNMSEDIESCWLMFFKVGKDLGLSSKILRIYIENSEEQSLINLAYLKILDDDVTDKRILNLLGSYKLTSEMLHCLAAFILLYQEEGYEKVKIGLSKVKSRSDIVSTINKKAETLGFFDEFDKDSLGIVIDILRWRKHESKYGLNVEEFSKTETISVNSNYCFLNYILHKDENLYVSLESMVNVYPLSTILVILLEGSFSGDFFKYIDELSPLSPLNFLNFLEIMSLNLEDKAFPNIKHVESVIDSDSGSMLFQLK